MRQRAIALACGLVVFCLASSTAEAQRRRLASRDAFAALDSSALADSTAMRQLNPSAYPDSLILHMLARLERTTPARDGTPTPVRWWNGFGTQAHPTLGILVDSIELADVINRVGSSKGQAGVPPTEIQRRLPYVYEFLVAHEHGHLLQYRELPPDSVGNLDMTRIIECSADFIGGFNTRNTFRERAMPDDTLSIPMQTVRDFGFVIGASDWLDATTHPLPEQRRECIKAGLAAGRLPDGVTNLVRWSLERATALSKQGAVSLGSEVFSVVRDTSLGRVVTALAQAAAQGRDAMRRLRAGDAPGGAFLLREAMAPPWRCTTRAQDDGEVATCRRTLREGEARARVLYDSVRTHVESVLEADGWIQSGEVRSAPEETHLAFAAFSRRTGLQLPRVELTLGMTGGGNPTAQLAPALAIAIVVRSANVP